MPRTTELRDRYGQTLTSNSPTAVELYVDALDRQLSLNAGAEAGFEAAIEADEGFALAHAGLAFARAFRGKAEAAKVSSRRARALAGGTSRRERQHLEAVAAFVSGESSRARGLIREHLAEFPRDALAIQMATMLISTSGSAQRQHESLALLSGVEPAFGDDWWFLGNYAFAHHEVGLFEPSRRFAERSLALYPRNAAAAHPLAHVFYETNDHAAGADFLDGWIPGYDRGGPYLCHLSWHLALFELASGHEARALELYEQAISPAVAQTRTTLVDAASLLWRYQIYGCEPRPLPWPEVCEYAARVTARPGVALADSHAALAYAAMGDEAAMATLIDGLRDLAAKGNQLAESVVLPLASGLQAFARGSYEEAVRLIEPLAEQLVRIGGSDAQREVFEDTLLEGYFRAGRFEQAEALLRRRLGRRGSARDVVWLERARASGQAAGPQLAS
jgi:tetratricopeptide (TPR) repeat protein